MFNDLIKILRTPIVKGIGLLIFLPVFLLPASLALEDVPSGFHISASTGFLRADFPKNFFLDPYQNEMRLDSSEAEDREAIFNYNSSISYGVSLGYSFKPKVFKDQVLNDVFHVYGQISFYPQFKFADETENVRTYQYDPIARKTNYQNLPYNQSGRKSYVVLIKGGFIFFPSEKIPIGIDGYFGSSIFHREYVSGATREYENTVDIDALKDGDIGDLKGNGKWDKNYLGFVGGLGLTYFFLKRLSITLMWEGGGNFKTEKKNILMVGVFILTEEI